MSTSERRSGRTLASLALAAAVAGFTGGCGTSLPPRVSHAPVLGVVTGLWPLGRAAALIGGNRASVTDVVPAGSDPFTYRLTSAQAAAVGRADLAVEAGGNLQPSFESAAAGARSVVSVGGPSGPAGGPAPYVWLDPASMGRAVEVLAAAMEKADPGAAPLYRRNASALRDQISSTGIDYSSVLTTCPHPVLIAPDAAFGALARSYDIRLVAVGATPSAGAVASAVGDLQSSRTAAVITQPWADNAGVRAVASSAGARTHPLDTLAGPPAGGWPPGADYFALMENNLGTLSNILGCASQNQ